MNNTKTLLNLNVSNIVTNNTYSLSDITQKITIKLDNFNIIIKKYNPDRFENLFEQIPYHSQR